MVSSQTSQLSDIGSFETIFVIKGAILSNTSYQVSSRFLQLKGMSEMQSIANLLQRKTFSKFSVSIKPLSF